MENIKIKILTKVISYLTKVKFKELERLRNKKYSKAMENFSQFRRQVGTYDSWKQVNKRN